MALRDDLLAPIAGSNPSGANLRYDPVTDTIKEARREDLDLAQGDWKTAIKTADYAQVIKLSSDVLAKRSKDLQIAVWLVDAHVRRDGFAILAPSFDFLRNLLDRFWETLYPEIEDDDIELRAAPLDWLGTKLEQPLLLLPITSSGLSFATYKQSRSVGYEQDAATPEREAARQQAITEGKPTAEEYDEAVNQTPRAFYDALHEHFAAALEKLQVLSEFCDKKFGDYGPSFHKTRTAIESIANQTRIFLGKKPPATAPVAAVQSAAPSEFAAPVQTPLPVAAVYVEAPFAQAVPAAPAVFEQSLPIAVLAPLSSSPAPTSLDDAIRRTGAICRFLRENPVHQTSAFLTIRALRWGELRNAAPDIDTEMLEAPPTELRTELKRNFASGQWDQVLTATENAMELPCGRAWLDLQRYTVMALENKGLAPVAAALRGALRHLLEDLPALIDQTFTDDTPLANAETRAWLASQVVIGPVSAGQVNTGLPLAEPALTPAPVLQPAPPSDENGKPPDLDSPDANAPKDVFEEALAAAHSSRPQDAVELISKQLASEQSGRGRFRRRTQLAHLLIMAGHKQIALPILEQLTAEIDQRQLQDWELGQALAYPVELLLGCLDANGDDVQERKQLYTRLCRLDPLRALKSTIS